MRATQERLLYTVAVGRIHDLARSFRAGSPPGDAVGIRHYPPHLAAKSHIQTSSASRKNLSTAEVHEVSSLLVCRQVLKEPSPLPCQDRRVHGGPGAHMESVSPVQRCCRSSARSQDRRPLAENVCGLRQHLSSLAGDLSEVMLDRRPHEAQILSRSIPGQLLPPWSAYLRHIYLRRL